MNREEKLAQYDALIEEREFLDILQLYFRDTTAKRSPDAEEQDGGVTAKLYRATGAAGGYVVICGEGDILQIDYLDALRKQLEYACDGASQPIRKCLERLAGTRDRLGASK